MAKKRKVTEKKAKKPAARRVAKSRAKPAATKRPSPRSGRTSVSNSDARNSASFEEAKSAAVDFLIQAIEQAERRLSAVKRAGSFDELRKLDEGRST